MKFLRIFLFFQLFEIVYLVKFFEVDPKLDIQTKQYYSNLISKPFKNIDPLNEKQKFLQKIDDKSIELIKELSEEKNNLKLNSILSFQENKNKTIIKENYNNQTLIFNINNNTNNNTEKSFFDIPNFKDISNNLPTLNKLKEEESFFSKKNFENSFFNIPISNPIKLNEKIYDKPFIKPNPKNTVNKKIIKEKVKKVESLVEQYVNKIIEQRRNMSNQSTINIALKKQHLSKYNNIQLEYSLKNEKQDEKNDLYNESIIETESDVFNLIGGIPHFISFNDNDKNLYS